MMVSDRRDGLLLSYYGDDFTGSTDVMESLVRAGIRTALFLEPPDGETLAYFPGLGAVGVAGFSRTMHPAEMDRVLPPIFAAMNRLGAPLFHYKTCSTFDSSPAIGSIGRALDIGQALFGSSLVPLVVGAPVLGRYCVFGNLFARSGLESEPYRLDRHPTMRRHPVTPMHESDLRIHLSQQTSKRVELVSVLDLASEATAAHRLAALRPLADEPVVVLFDVLTDAHLPIIGRLLAGEMERRAPLFVVGSSGVEYALTAHLRAIGSLPAPVQHVPVPRVDRLVVASGSCSPVTDRQIGWALQHGFAEIPLEPADLLDPDRAANTIDRATEQALDQLGRGPGVILHLCRGPHDPRIECTARCVASLGLGESGGGRVLGESLGRILRMVLERSGLSRAAVTGGDTSGYVARELGIQALEMIGPLAPGAPLCRIYAPASALHGHEIVFKGGQVGTRDFLGRVMGDAP